MSSFVQYRLSSSRTATLFDVIAEQSLRTSLKPAWEYVLKVFAQKYPAHSQRVLKYSDEIFYAVLLVVEEYSLRCKLGSTTERFYELARECTAPETSFLFRYAKTLSLLSVVVLPYLFDKLQRYQDKLNERGNRSTLTENLPLILTAFQWMRTINYIRYVFSFTGYARPLLYLTRIQLKYDNGLRKEMPSAQLPIYARMLRLIPDVTASVLMKMAPLFFYSLQFIELFYDHESGVSKMIASLPVPKPPPVPEISSAGVSLPASKTLCPLCRRSHVNPTTIVNSGFVFCYTCLFTYIEKHGCCPVTYRKCALKDMIKIRKT